MALTTAGRRLVCDPVPALISLVGNQAIAYVPGTLSVSPAALTVTARDAAKTYDGLGFSGGNVASYAGLVIGETAAVLGGSLAYGGTAQGAVNAGSYSLTASGLTAANYAISYAPGMLSVSPAALTVTARDAAKTYDGLSFSGGNGVVCAGLVNGETAAVLGGSLAYGGTAQVALNAGSYSLTASGLTSSDYTISYAPGTLRVNASSVSTQITRTLPIIFSSHYAPVPTRSLGTSFSELWSTEGLALLGQLRMPDLIRAARAGGQPIIRFRRPADHRGRAKRWCATVDELVQLQAEYQVWLDALPQALQETATAETLRSICDLGPPGASDRRTAERLRT